MWENKRANEGIRTPDRALTKRLLYRLSYVGVGAIIPDIFRIICKKNYKGSVSLFDRI